METRAPFVIVGAFVLAAIAAVFGFIYWLHNAGGLGPRASYHVQFEGSVPGLLVGAAVLFNGIRVGLERMTGVTTPSTKITYDLRALQNQGPAGKTVNVQWAIPEPTAVAMLETQRFLFSPAQDYPGFSEAMWADSLPKLLQARL